jgi:hypothetical protein
MTGIPNHFENTKKMIQYILRKTGHWKFKKKKMPSFELKERFNFDSAKKGEVLQCRTYPVELNIVSSGRPLVWGSNVKLLHEQLW